VDAGEDHGSRRLASFLGEPGEGIFNRGGEPVDYSLKVERKRIIIDKAMSNVKAQNPNETNQIYLKFPITLPLSLVGRGRG
jgi:hypothetical protein